MDAQSFEGTILENHWLRKGLIVLLIVGIILGGNYFGIWSIDNIMSWMEEQIHTQLFQDYAPVFIFLYTAAPSAIPMPSEVLKTPVLLGSDEPYGMAIFLIAISIGGGMFGDTLWFLLVRRGHHFQSAKEEHEELEEEHLFHKYGKFVFVVSPSIPFVAELPLVFAAVTGMQYRIFAPWLLLGHSARAIIGMILLMIGLGYTDISILI